jgi:NADPH:quinone reductase-like Zn-dependent oxidoreductase
MPKAVRYDSYGGLDVLYLADVPRPVPGPGQALIEVKAAGINPGESKIRNGDLRDRWPSTFPSGQGSDLAGIVAELAAGVDGFSVGDEVIGWVDTRSSQAEFVAVDAENLTRRPSEVSWEEAGGLFGVGSLAVQLARLAGARVIGLASVVNHEWLADHGVIGVAYGDGVAERILAAADGKVDAFIDTVGGDYVELALSLGLAPERIDTVANFAAVAKYGVKADGNAAGASAAVLAELAGLVDTDQLELTIAATYPLADVRAAYAEIERGHTRGKIVLIP